MPKDSEEREAKATEEMYNYILDSLTFIFLRNLETMQEGNVGVGRAHVEKIEFIVQKAIKESKLNLENLDGIAATAGPGLIVCLTVGLNTGKAIAGSLKKPFVAVNHLEGHALSPKINKKIEKINSWKV